MLLRLRLIARKTLGQASWPALVKQLCPNCSGFVGVQARSYAFAPPSRLRERSAISEFSAGPSKPPRSSINYKPRKLDATDSLLKAQLQTIFASHISAIDPKHALQVAYPLIFRRHGRSLLDPRLQALASLISPLITQGSLTEEESRQGIVVLGHCYGRTIERHAASAEVDEIAQLYADALIALAMRSKSDQEKTKELLEALTAALERLSKGGPAAVLQPPIIVAWVVLRVHAGVTDPPKNTCVFPKPDETRELLRRLSETHAEPLEEYIKALHILTSQAGEEVVWLPNSKDALEVELASLRKRNDWDGIVNLWTRVRAGITSPIEGKEKHWILDSSPHIRYPVLSSFLLTFLRPIPPSIKKRIDSPPTASFFATSRQVLDLCPRPLPRTIAYTLLALRVRPDGNEGVRAGHEVFSLDIDERHSDANEALKGLKETWRNTGERDMKMYMIYIEGLGRLGDLEGLKDVWNELVKDGACRRLYLMEENLPASTPFPPIHALNQMISACLLIPLEGPAIALDIFDQASRPDSAVPCNLVTINTMLRHHARAANIPAMSALFEQATQLNINPDVITYTTLVQGLLRARRLDLAKGALDLMQAQGIVPNERMCSMLIADLAKLGTRTGLAHAEELLNLMRQHNMRTNEVTWTALVSGYFRGGWEDEAWEAVERMERLDIHLNRVGFNMLFKEAGGAPDGLGTIMRLWKKMLNQGVTPNSDTYFLVLGPLVKQGWMPEVEEVLGEMRRQGFRPEKSALSRLINSISRA